MKQFFKNFYDSVFFATYPETYFFPIYTEALQKHFEYMQVLNEVRSHNKDCYIGIGSLIGVDR